MKTYEGIEAARRFVELLDGHLENDKACWRTYADRGRVGPYSYRGTFEDVLPKFEKQERLGASAFRVINLGGHSDASITDVVAFFIDKDGGDLPDWHLPPTFTCNRGDHVHAYWVLAVPLMVGDAPGKGDFPKQDFRRIQKALAEHFDSDPKVCNLSRVMRVPGFTYQKTGPGGFGYTLTDFEDDGRYYTLEQITEGLLSLPRIGFTYATKRPNHDSPPIDLDLEENIQHAVEWLKEREPSVAGQNGDDWTYETCQYLRDFGLSEEKAHEVLNMGWNQRSEPPWASEELERVIRNAYAYGQNWPGCKAPTYQAQRIVIAHGRDAVPLLTKEQKAELFHPKPTLAVDNTARLAWEEAEGIPSDGYPVRSLPSTNDGDEDLFPAYLVGELDWIPDPAWLIRDILPEMSLCMTYGDTGSLKTFLEIDKALWGATGQPWAASQDHDIEGFKVTRPLRTVILAGEGARGIKRRIAAWSRRHGTETKNLPILVVPVMPRFAVEGDIEKLIRTIEAKLPNPDNVIVDTAMWAASGLNLNIPADSQVFLEACKRVMLALSCCVTFVHHTGKDKSRGQLGAENLKAGVDVVDFVELAEKTRGRRKIKITNIKMKDDETRGLIHMEAYPETVGQDVDGRPISSLVLRRCHGPKNEGTDTDDDPRLKLALEIIAENKGKMALSMNALAEEMARSYATDELTDGELEKAKERMRYFLRKAAKDELASFAHKTSKANNATWEFEDRTGR